MKLSAWDAMRDSDGMLRDGAPVRVGDASIPLRRMRDSTPLIGDADALRREYETHGYLFLRGLLPRADVLAARSACCARLSQLGRVRAGDEQDDAEIETGASHGVSLFEPELQSSPQVRAALESPALVDLFATLFGEPASTYSYKWLRAVGRDEFTGAHLDRVYMGRGSQSLMTAWIPLGATPLEHGTIVVRPGTHAAPEFEELRCGYGALDVDRDCPGDPHATGHLTNDPATWAPKAGYAHAWDPAPLFARLPAEERAAGWASADFEAGDVVLFGINTLHMSTTNTTSRFRLSCDTRWQPSSQPVDERWAGGPTDGKAHRHFCGDQPIPRAPE